ncbi:MAG: ATP-binding cassette domain-containing protein [Bacteroidetes bacterium]|nr:ATP-binding cassette domain-containing protein [Bacteroidota bacterium]
MKITLTDVGKRFNRDWIFRHINYGFTNGNSYAIIGPNGSGKSTLLQVIAGAVAQSEGSIGFQSSVFSSQPADSQKLSTDNCQLPTEKLHSHISLATPYLEVIEEMTLVEFLRFHSTFKPFITGMDIQKISGEVGLEKSIHKQIRYFSSGMKQRVKLAQAFFSDTFVLLLDEPCTNLDEEGIALYHHLIKNYSSNRIIIISSNDKQEYDFCKERLNILDYKK